MISCVTVAKSTAPKSRTVQCSYQISATLASDKIPDVNKRFVEARSLALWWMNRRVKSELGRGIPPPAWEGHPFEIDQHGQLYGAVTVPDLELWTCRLEHDDPEVPARTWAVDLALRRVDPEVILVERTLCVSPGTCAQPVPLNVPKIVRDLIRKVGMKDVVPITGDPWYLKSSSDLKLLELLLSDTGRLLPVVMLTEAEETTADRAYQVARFVLDPAQAAADLVGVAHVVVMPRSLGFEWTNQVGRMWSAFGGAIRTFRPSLSFGNDDPYRHPLAKLDDIVFWEYEGIFTREKVYGETAFLEFLKEKMFQTVALRPLRHEDTLFYRYAKVRSLSASTARRAESSPIEEELRLEIVELRKQVEQERGEKDWVFEELAKQEESVQLLEKERFNLRAQVESLRTGLGKQAHQQIALPASLDELGEWQSNLAGQLWIAPKAIAAACKSEFRDPKLVFESLLLLANEYRQMRIHGGSEFKNDYEEGLRRLKVTEARSIAESRLGEQGQEYYVNHPFQAGKRVLLEDHLRRGTDRDQRKSMRIYFAWEPQEQLVIVGWLPSHLTTRNS